MDVVVAASVTLLAVVGVMTDDTAAQGKTVILDPGPVRPLPVDFYSCYQMITPNKTEAQALVRFPMTDIPSAARAAQSLVERGVRVAIIKLGAQGAYFAIKEGGRLLLLQLRR